VEVKEIENIAGADIVSAYDEFMKFLAQNRSPEEVIAFKASPASQHRVDELG
jgi:hypothetical protein